MKFMNKYLNLLNLLGVIEFYSKPIEIQMFGFVDGDFQNLINFGC